MAIPTYLSEVPPDTDVSAAETGARLLGVSLFEQGLNVARVCEAKDSFGLPLYPTVAVLMPRRSTKTTSIWCLILGRCATIPGYRVVTTAQDGTRAGNKMREMMRELEAHGFEDSGMGVLRWSNGRERIEFTNGSVVWVVAPNSGAFRSEAADLMLFDESGELDAEKSADLLAGALPLLDTRPLGQAIIAGTPAEDRVGLLWDTLQEARTGEEETTGIVDYSIRDDEEAVYEDEDGKLQVDEEILARVHPGIGTLTSLAKIKSRLNKMGRLLFEREYLCRFPFDSTTHAINLHNWEAGASEFVERPERVGIAYDVPQDGSSGALVAVWRDADGVPVVEVLAFEGGTQWLPRAVQAAHAKHTRYAVAYDNIGPNVDIATAVRQMRPAPRLQALGTKEIMAAAQRFANEIASNGIRHFDQADLNAAVENAGWRDVLRSGRAFGKRNQRGAPINTLVAASLALWQYDQTREGGAVLPI